MKIWQCPIYNDTLEDNVDFLLNSLHKQKHGVLIYIQSDKTFKDTVVNRTLTSLHGGSHEITLTVPLKI